MHAEPQQPPSLPGSGRASNSNKGIIAGSILGSMALLLLLSALLFFLHRRRRRFRSGSILEPFGEDHLGLRPIPPTTESTVSLVGLSHTRKGYLSHQRNESSGSSGTRTTASKGGPGSHQRNLSAPAGVANNGGQPRVMVHTDSGVRLSPTASLIEVPPGYTER